MIRRVLFVFILCVAGRAAERVSFNRDVRPILSEHCFSCHGPDSASRKGDFRIDRAEETALRKDEVLKRIFTSDEDDVMPPLKTKKVLRAEEKELLRRWLAEGAAYEAHWSFIAPARAELPKGVENPIDAFVGAGLEKAGLAMNEEADRAALARRVSLDLTGLPPAPEVVEGFVGDETADAYEMLVDSLLASERHGEHRARYWLDAARYADTHGIHYDNYREIWAYRDWVIAAFNANMPFDQFTIEQLAGDLLEKPTMEQRIATGFNRCNITTSEAGAIDEEYHTLYTRDRTETTATVWLGLTAGCAVCHDHKYDPLTQREFYALSAFFNNTTQPAMDGDVKDTPPTIVVPATEDRGRWEALGPLRDAAKSEVDRRRQEAAADFAKWLGVVKPAEILEGIPAKDLVFSAALTEGPPAALAVFVNGYPREIPVKAVSRGAIAENAFVTGKGTTPTIEEVGDFERDQAFSFGAWIKLDAENRNGSILARMDEDASYSGWDLWFDDGRPGTHIVSKWPENAFKISARKALGTNTWHHVFVTYDGSSAAEGVRIYVDGHSVSVERPNSKLDGSIRTKAPFKIGQRKKGQPVNNAGLQDVRIYSRALTRSEVLALRDRARMAFLVSRPVSERTEEERKALFDGYLHGFDPEHLAAAQRHDALEKETTRMQKRGTVAHVMNEKKTAAMAHVLARGEYDKRRDEVAPGTPATLHRFGDELPRNRLGLAKWLVSAENPLTTRVVMNRMWQELFGEGLVRTVGDFGVSGELPSNQALLDWLAVEFRESGWDMKRMYKLMVTSATYRQSARVTPEKLAKDPANLLISRGPRFRMDAEMIRDYALSASGLLSGKIGGPSVKPYQPDDVWEMVGMMGSNTRVYERDAGEALHRRSLYTFWKRTAPHPALDTFNAPSREICTVKRERTNTPLQALVTLNDVQFIEAARALAQRAMRSSVGERERLDFMARQLLARGLRDTEETVLRGTLAKLKVRYEEAPAKAAELLQNGEAAADASLNAVELAAYTMVANVMFNLDETLNK